LPSSDDRFAQYVAIKASFTHQGIPRGKLFGLIDLDHRYELWGNALEQPLYYILFSSFSVWGFWLIEAVPMALLGGIGTILVP